MRAELEQRIAGIARRQHGVVTRSQLLVIGVSPGAVRHALGTGRFQRLHAGIYLVGPLSSARTSEMAAVLACGPRAVLSHRSAARLWGLLPATGEHGGAGTSRRQSHAAVDVSVPMGHRIERTGIRVRRVRRLEPYERTERLEIPVTTPGRTLVDLAAIVGSRDLEQAVARAQRERLVGRQELIGLPERYPRRPGIPALRAVLERQAGPALTRSEAEARFLTLIREARLPAPDVNARIAGREVDFLWRAEGIAVEIDGYRYHSAIPRFEGDRRRITHLAAHGIQVIPLTWRQVVEDRVATAVQLGKALLLRGAPAAGAPVEGDGRGAAGSGGP